MAVPYVIAVVLTIKVLFHNKKQNSLGISSGLKPPLKKSKQKTLYSSFIELFLFSESGWLSSNLLPTPKSKPFQNSGFSPESDMEESDVEMYYKVSELLSPPLNCGSTMKWS